MDKEYQQDLQLTDLKNLQKTEIEGKGKIFYDGKFYPKEFGWFLILKEMIKRGFKLKLYYDRIGNDVRDQPDKFSMDAENNMAPIMPLKVEVFQESVTLIQDELSSIFGLKVERTNRQIAEINNLRGLDPEPMESLEMMFL